MVYEIPCKNCNSKYIGETGRVFKTRLEEHRKEVEQEDRERKFTRSEKCTNQGTVYKSAVTDHVMHENHVIDWEGAKVIDHESYMRSRHVREAIWIRRNKPAVLNRDEGAFQLSHLYDQVFAAPPSGRLHRQGGATSNLQ